MKFGSTQWSVTVRPIHEDGKLGTVVVRTTASRAKTREGVEAWATKKFSSRSPTGKVFVSIWDPKAKNEWERKP